MAFRTQQAFHGVSDALVEYRKDREFREHQEQLVSSAEAAARLSETHGRSISSRIKTMSGRRTMAV